MENHGTVRNTLDFKNAGTLTNIGIFDNEGKGTIANFGTLDTFLSGIDPCGPGSARGTVVGMFEFGSKLPNGCPDSEPPTWSVPADINVGMDPGLATASVTYEATPSDKSNANLDCVGETIVIDHWGGYGKTGFFAFECLPVSDIGEVKSSFCNPVTGSIFSAGTSSVQCSATDAADNVGSVSFDVIVSDREAPIMTGPTELVRSTDSGESFARVDYWSPGVFNSSDNVGVHLTDCSPQAGEKFFVGTTPVKCLISDAAGNQAEFSFNIVVQDNEAPTWDVPETIQVNTDPGLASAIVPFPNYPNWPNDNVGVTHAICSPATGSNFALGVTTVNCSAEDAAGNTGKATFNVIVIDNEPPAVVAPAGQTVEATGPTGAVVTWGSPTVTDNVGITSLICSPASGSTFPLGTNAVTCQAWDAAGNVGSASFNVTVEDTTAPALSIDEVVTVSDGLYLSESFTTFPATAGSPLVTLGGTVSDLVGVANIMVDGVDANYDSSAGTWSLAGITLQPGANTLNAVTSDAAGNTTFVAVVVMLDTDLDDDGIANNVDGGCDGTSAYKDANNFSFSDLKFGGLTCGVIVDDGGSIMTITDAADPAKGLHVVVEADAQLQLAGKASTIFLSAGTEAEITDPDATITVNVLSGEVTVQLTVAGIPVIIVVSADASATFTETSNLEGMVYSLDLLVSPEDEDNVSITFNGTAVSGSVSFLAPTDKDQCKEGGWKAFNFPGQFKNQGQCKQFVKSLDTKKGG
jgi:hypothetical protein